MAIFRIFLASVFACFLAMPGMAQLIRSDADFAVILDGESGQVLFEKNGAMPMVPASMTKIMTTHLVFERLRNGEISLQDRLTVSENAWRLGGWATGGSTMGLKIGETPTIEDLLRGVIVLSGNDACIVLAEGLSGSEAAFAEEMTEAAQRMGLKSAHFKNVNGLYAEGHEISAIDMAKLAQATIAEYPEYYDFYAQTEMTWNGIRQANRNPLLGKMDGADGLKTGHLEASGYGLTASALRDGVRRIIVINGLESSSTRAQEAERLMRIAFDAFETRTAEADGAELAELDVWLGEQKRVGVKLSEPVRITAHKRAYKDAITEIVIAEPIKAPVSEGDQLAELHITIDGHEPVVTPLVATANVSRLGFLGRAVEGLSRKIAPES